ncbi:DUF4232 domain-containing protein [Streptomyces sp. NBC_01136]|uniref:DUF4232 domain-containing protein n=1 Tax=unclassified Streptomyces TaxID=2593676 RepID=UPI00324B3FA1|nr:DUF4232 domain-containing protein [Streptomyces sp. NBC_01136]
MVSAGRSDRPDGGRVGDFATQIVLRNSSRSTCSLRGWAGLTVYGDDAILACGAGDSAPHCGKPVNTTDPRPVTVTRTTGPAPTLVLLTPGGKTSYGLLWTLELGPNCYAPTHWEPPYGARIWIPGDSHPLTLAPLPDLQACEGRFQIIPIGTPA